MGPLDLIDDDLFPEPEPEPLIIPLHGGPLPLTSGADQAIGIGTPARQPLSTLTRTGALWSG
eukprot:scaffold33374_cov124-Isochrysis_galbana.AAC.2